MKKYSKRDYLFNGLLALFVIGVVLLITRGTYFFGSKLDWSVQHYNIPDYFRKQFYETGKIIPEFAANIGAGQNEFNFAYYGLMNPFILISYLFQFVSMRTYIMVLSVILVIVSSWLFYRWIHGKFGTRVAFFSSFLFVCASPLIFHSHRHIMFVSYMVFMVLGLMGVDRYFYDKKKALLIISSTCMIFTSYFFSVGGLIALTIYAIGTYLEITSKVTVKDFFVAALKFAVTMMCSVCMSAVLLLPTLYTLLNGRSESNISINMSELFIPDFHDGFILYNTYSLGLTAISVIAIIYGVFSKYKRLRFVSICLALMTYIGVFVYVLNGAMYMDGKALIPFLPLTCYVTASMLSKLIRHEYEFKRLLKIVIIGNIPLVLTFHSSYFFVYAVDVIVTMFGIFYFNSTSKFRYFAFNSMLIAAIVCIMANFHDKLVSKDSKYIKEEKKIEHIMTEIEQEDDFDYRIGNKCSSGDTLNTIYNMQQYSVTLYSSVYNMDYNKFFYKEMCNENPYRNSAITSQPTNLLFNLYMGNRYIIGEDVDIKGYNKIGSDGDINIYKNENALSLGNCVYKSISENAYNNLSYPYSVLTLYSMAVTPDSANNEPDIPDVDVIDIGDITSYDKEGIITKKENDSYVVSNCQKEKVQSRTSKEIDIPLPEEYTNGEYVFFVKMKVDNSLYSDSSNSSLSNYHHKDVIISVNDIHNKLTDPDWKYYNDNELFEYTIAQNKPIDTLKILFYDGEYVISDFCVYGVKYEDIIKASVRDSMIINKDRTKGNVIEGDIDCSKDGYFVLTVPYDEGFRVYCDGKEQTITKTDKAFIGFTMESGKHNIRVVYNSPFLKEGKMLSVFGIFMTMIVVMSGIKRKKSGTDLR